MLRNPKLVRHIPTGGLHAMLYESQIRLRSANLIHVVPVRHLIGPFYRETGPDKFDTEVTYEPVE